MTETLAIIRKRLEQEKGRLSQIRSDIAKVETSLANLSKYGQVIEKAAWIIQEVARQTQQYLSVYIDDTVTSAIDSVFNDTEFSFYLEFVPRRGRTEADLFLADANGNRVKPSDADGGGLVNVAAFALRVSFWSIRKTSRPTLFLDEPFHFLHNREAHAKVAELLKLVSDRLKLQIIMVTGEDESQEILSMADRVFRIVNGKLV